MKNKENFKLHTEYYQINKR